MIGQFAVHNLRYGQKFQKQTLICSSKSFYIEEMIKGTLSYVWKPCGLGCDFQILPNLNLCLFENEAEEETES